MQMLLKLKNKKSKRQHGPMDASELSKGSAVHLACFVLQQITG